MDLSSGVSLKGRDEVYIQITTRCNMEGEHCCYDCSADGVDMSKETFKAACKLAEEMGEIISVGGGEPTIHPEFWEFIGIALQHTSDTDGGIWMATNGKETSTALKLADLARRGVLSVELSQDYYHEDIDPDVITAFTPTKRGEYVSRYSEDCRGIRDVTLQGIRDPIPVGRAAEWATSVLQCVCDDLFIVPNGIIYACGCQKKNYGTVYSPVLPEERPDQWCSEDYE